MTVLDVGRSRMNEILHTCHTEFLLTVIDSVDSVQPTHRPHFLPFCAHCSALGYSVRSKKASWQKWIVLVRSWNSWQASTAEGACAGAAVGVIWVLKLAEQLFLVGQLSESCGCQLHRGWNKSETKLTRTVLQDLIVLMDMFSAVWIELALRKGGKSGVLLQSCRIRTDQEGWATRQNGPNTTVRVLEQQRWAKTLSTGW